jgi:PAS domain S-box-containing protein
LLFRCALATLFVFSALLLNSLPPAQNLPFLFFFAAVALTARVCGFGPAAYATVLSALVADYFFLPPKFGWALTGSDFLKILLFALVCLLIISIAKQKSIAERAADENRARLAAIIQSSEDAILSKTLDGIITSWNKGAERLYGYTEAEVIGKHVSLISPPELRDDILTIMTKLRKGEQIEHYHTERLCKDGRRVQVSVSISPIHASDGTVIGASAIARDITSQRQAEETLRRTEKLAATGRLAASVAHEINNPLESVTNLLYLIGNNPSLDAKGRRHLARAEKELERVAHISRQTLGFYRETSAPARINLAETLDEVLAIYAAKLEAKSVTVEKKYRPVPEIQAIAGEIRQVFSNLIANAIDALAMNGRLMVRIAKSQSWENGSRLPGVRVSIADNGSGISPDHQQKLFQPFFTTKDTGGTGLGLWVSKGIIERHRGSIQARSSIDDRHGTVFTILLPETYQATDWPR